MVLNCEAILFDMDGTLVDSTEVVERAWARWAARHGLNLEEILEFSHGRPTLSTMERFRAILPAEVDLEGEAREMELFEEEQTDGIIAIPGAARALESVQGGLWGVVTSAPRRLAVNRLRAANLGVPPVLVPADEIQNGKPHPEGFLKAAQLLQVAASECLVFEDTRPGLLAAEAAGMRAIGLLTTFSREQLGGDSVIDDFNAIQIKRCGNQFVITANVQRGAGE